MTSEVKLEPTADEIDRVRDIIVRLLSRDDTPKDESRIRRLESQVEALEALRPHWAMGYTSDSMAAQASTAALSGLWGLLGVNNQTDACAKVRSLLARAARTPAE